MECVRCFRAKARKQTHTVKSRNYPHLRGSYIWSPAEGKGGGRGSKSGRYGSHSRQADPNLERREPPGATQVTRGPWRSNPPSESQPAASGWKRVTPHYRQVTVHLISDYFSRSGIGWTGELDAEK